MSESVSFYDDLVDRREQVDKEIAALKRERADLSVEITKEWQKSIELPSEEVSSGESEQPDSARTGKKPR